MEAGHGLSSYGTTFVEKGFFGEIVTLVGAGEDEDVGRGRLRRPWAPTEARRHRFQVDPGGQSRPVQPPTRATQASLWDKAGCR
jgi:hypothetical protein